MQYVSTDPFVILNEFVISNMLSIYVTGFEKMCIVHTSDFAHLEIHKNHREWYTDLKLLGLIKE